MRQRYWQHRSLLEARQTLLYIHSRCAELNTAIDRHSLLSAHDAFIFIIDLS